MTRPLASTGMQAYSARIRASQRNGNDVQASRASPVVPAWQPQWLNCGCPTTPNARMPPWLAAPRAEAGRRMAAGVDRGLRILDRAF